LKITFIYAALTISIALSAQQSLSREWTERKLRGLGDLSAEVTEGDGFSRLDIQCESSEKASVLHAKFVSDFHAMGGVTDESRTLNGVEVPVFMVSGQSIVSAYRRGKRVTILSATNEAGWQQGINELKRDLAHAELQPQSRVPMYLNSWDQYGFRFYYRPWELPGRDVKWSGYPVLNEFDFAQRENSRGFVFWSETANIDNAVDLDNDRWWEWAERAAARRGLPVVINTMNVVVIVLMNL